MNDRAPVLVTGAAGTIGSSLSRFLAGRFRLRLADLHPERLPQLEGAAAYPLDIRDLDACREAADGMGTVVHLAADPSIRAGFYESLLDTNIAGTFNVFRAAKDAGCRRVIFASSLHAITGYPLDFQAHPDTPVRPGNVYGVSKCFGEALASYFAHEEGLSAIAVRIGAYAGNSVGDEPDARILSCFLSERDMHQLFLRCIEAPDIQFAIVHGVSNNRFKRLDLTATRRLLGYRPVDDAFRIFGAGLRYRVSWFTDPDTGEGA